MSLKTVKIRPISTFYPPKGQMNTVSEPSIEESFSPQVFADPATDPEESHRTFGEAAHLPMSEPAHKFQPEDFVWVKRISTKNSNDCHQCHPVDPPHQLKEATGNDRWIITKSSDP